MKIRKSHTTKISYIPVRCHHALKGIITYLCSQKFTFSGSTFTSEFSTKYGKGTVKVYLHISNYKYNLSVWYLDPIASYKDRCFQTNGSYDLKEVPEEMITFDPPDYNGHPLECIFLRYIKALTDAIEKKEAG